jgi:hypothetical protein
MTKDILHGDDSLIDITPIRKLDKLFRSVDLGNNVVCLELYHLPG